MTYRSKIVQTKGAFYRAFNMFLTTPKQYFEENVGLRNYYELEAASKGKQGKGTLWQEMQDQYGYIILLCQLSFNG